MDKYRHTFVTKDGFEVRVSTFNPYDYGSYVFLAGARDREVNSTDPVKCLCGRDVLECLLGDGPYMTKAEIEYMFNWL